MASFILQQSQHQISTIAGSVWVETNDNQWKPLTKGQ